LPGITAGGSAETVFTVVPTSAPKDDATSISSFELREFLGGVAFGEFHEYVEPGVCAVGIDEEVRKYSTRTTWKRPLAMKSRNSIPGRGQLTKKVNRM
jgi:hypothetical protein